MAPETTVTVVWPTIGATAAGRLVGSWVGFRPRFDRFAIIGRLLAFLSIPLSLAVFFWQLMPFVARRYRLTNQRLILEKGLGAQPEKSVALDQFDSIEVVELPGQKWLRAGDLVFRHGGNEVLRLAGVPHPEPFRVACLKQQQASVLFGQLQAAAAAQ